MKHRSTDPFHPASAPDYVPVAPMRALQLERLRASSGATVIPVSGGNTDRQIIEV